MPNEPSPLEQPELMRAILDLVIPPREDGVLPGAGALGLAAEVVKRLQADAAYGPRVAAGLTAVRTSARARNPQGFTALTAEAQREVLRSQLPEHPALMGGLTRHLYVAYYQHPTVLAGLGQAARPPFPVGFEVEETDPELLTLLKARRIPPPDA